MQWCQCSFNAKQLRSQWSLPFPSNIITAVACDTIGIIAIACKQYICIVDAVGIKIKVSIGLNIKPFTALVTIPNNHTANKTEGTSFFELLGSSSNGKFYRILINFNYRECSEPLQSSLIISKVKITRATVIPYCGCFSNFHALLSFESFLPYCRNIVFTPNISFNDNSMLLMGYVPQFGYQMLRWVRDGDVKSSIHQTSSGLYESLI